MDVTPHLSPQNRIGFLLIDGFALLSYAAAMEPLRAANLQTGGPFYDIRHFCAHGEVARSSSGAVIEADNIDNGQTDLDLLLVIAGGDPVAFQNLSVFRWLRELAARGVRLGGVSGGPVILALAGVVEGRRLTVHWEHAEALAEISPSLLLERSLYVIDRDRVSCAGGTAALDMMHALLTENHGSAFTRKISDWFMHTEVRPSGGPQRAGLEERYGSRNPVVISAIEAMENHIADPLALPQLAGLAGVGSRQINRLFQSRMGISTMSFYSDLRLEKARSLVMQSPLSITDIALATGFASSAHFSAAFRKKYNLTPSSLRV